jgi:hypothetical protein
MEGTYRDDLFVGVYEKAAGHLITTEPYTPLAKENHSSFPLFYK